MDRRSFLRSTATAGAGFALSPSMFARAGDNKKDIINLALVGAGAQGEVLINACMKMGEDSGIHFKAVCDIREELSLKRVVNILSRYGQRANGYLDYRQMLDKETQLDAVLIATPDFCHAEQAVASLEAGLHVYCEAPMSNTLDGARKMAKAAKQTGRLLQVGHQRRSNPRYIHCYEKLLHSAGIFGHITAVNAQSNHPARPDRGWSKRRVIDQTTLAKYGYKSMHHFKNWMWYKGLGCGPLVDYGSHQMDILNWFLAARPRSVTARGGTYYYDKKTHEWCDTAMAILEYETKWGIVGAFYQTITANGYGGHFEAFMGDQGTLKISESANNIGIYRDPEAPDWEKWVRLGFLSRPGMKGQNKQTEGVIEVEPTKPPVRYEMPVALSAPYHQPHLANFFEAIRGGNRLNSPAEVAYETTVVALKVSEAIEAGHTLIFKTEEFEM